MSNELQISSCRKISPNQSICIYLANCTIASLSELMKKKGGDRENLKEQCRGDPRDIDLNSASFSKENKQPQTYTHQITRQTPTGSANNRPSLSTFRARFIDCTKHDAAGDTQS